MSRRGSPAVLFLLLVLLAAESGAETVDWTVEIDGALRPVRSRVYEEVEYLSAADLAEAFGGWLQEDPKTGHFILEVAGTRMILSAQSGLASIEGRIVSLPHPNRRGAEGDLWVVPELVERAISPFYPRSIERLELRFRVRGLPPIEVKLRASRDAAGTRVVLQFSRAVRYEVDQDPEGVRVMVLDGPLDTGRIPRRVTGDEVRSIRFVPTSGEEGGSFLFEAGSEFAGARSSHLGDPFRVILDFAKAGGTSLPAPRRWTRDRPADTTTAARGVHTLILDPGHGGGEAGAQGPTGLYEKDVVLDIARRVARIVRARLQLEVVLTRNADKIIPLEERAGIANHREGDLFISIHANASRGPLASGAETYFLSLTATDAAAHDLAAAENLLDSAGDAEPESDGLDMLLWDLAQADHRVESFQLAETIQQELNNLLGTRDRGVRQAPFRVLMGVSMPAVLVEVAFISNPEEEAALRTDEFLEMIAEALATSIAHYKRTYEERLGIAGRPAGDFGRGSP